MSEQLNSITNATEERQKQLGLWAAGIFTALSVAFAGISIYAVFVVQQGQFQLEDAVLVPTTIIATIIGLLTYFLIRRGRYQLGSEILFVIMMTLPVTAILLLDNFEWIVASYIAIFTPIMFTWILPKAVKQRAVVIVALVIVVVVSIELWNPGFRGTSTVAISIIPMITPLAAVVLLAYIARQAWGGNIRFKVVTAFMIVALVSLGILGTVTYTSYRNQMRADIRQRLHNIISLVAMNQNGDLHATINGPENAEDESHVKILAQNVEYLATDPALKYIYTMRKDEQGQIYFVINARQGGEPGDPIGTIYNEPSDLLRTQFDILSSPVIEEDLYTDVYGSVLASYAPFYRSDGTREGIIGVDMDAEKILAEERAILNQIIGTTLVSMLLVTLLGLFLGNVFTKPIINLSLVAQKITDGNLSARAEVETADEVGGLAKAFNTMTSQLQSTLQGLEQRVADRTRNLELAAEVGHAVSQVRSLDVMLKDACELILKEFNLYYVQVYLTDPSQTKLVLEAGTGEVGAQLLGRSHSLPLTSGSINGRAALEKRSIVIADTLQSETFLPNPLLPDTRGEMAVPLIVADRVVGVLDIQSHTPGALSAEVLPAFEALAGQLAVAIQNANLLAETEQARAQVEAQARRLVREGWQEHLDAIHKPEQFGYVFAHNKVAPLAEMEEAQIPDDEKTVSVPIAVTGEPLGSLVIEIEDEARREQTSELVNVVARQVAQQIENLRLLESAERYRHEAERAARLQTIEGWQEYIKSKSTDSLGYLYDLEKVRLVHDEPEHDNMLTLPLKARDERVGKLAVKGLTHEDQEAVELASAVAERLGTHIENLRLFEESRRGQVELDKRARQLAAVAEISNISSRELDVQKMLESVVQLAQRQFGLYHAHIFVFNEATEELQITACGWKEGDEHEGTREIVSIPLTREQSLVARAARTRQAVIVNDVKDEPGWLPNPLLPDTASELAVPLIISDQILGVLDVQSDRVNAFTAEDANIQATLASQVATAMQNARSFTQAQKQAEREAMLNVINQKIQSATSVEAVLQIAARELGHALGAPMTVAQLSMKDRSS